MSIPVSGVNGPMENNPLPRLDERPDIRELLLPHCRLTHGQIWTDAVSGHRVGCLDAANANEVATLMDGNKAAIAIHDPPYNLVAFEERTNEQFIRWCKEWARNTLTWMEPDASLYVWLGADQKNGFQPLPDFMIMMRTLPVSTRSFITMRNQRGYGYAKKLDGRPAGITLLYDRQPRFQCRG